jgi:hypothetical protein
LNKFQPIVSAISIDVDQIEENLNKKEEFNGEELLPYLKNLEKAS